MSFNLYTLEDLLEHRETRWSVNESLLQSYRQIFISSQSFLLAVGAVTFDRYAILNVLLAVLSLVMIWWIWIPVVRARRRIVDYYKFTLGLSESQAHEFLKNFSESDYVRNGQNRRAANQFLESTLDLKRPISDLRETRLKVDVYLPLGFSLIWLMFLVPSIFQLLKWLIP